VTDSLPGAVVGLGLASPAHWALPHLNPEQDA
jgi:hypothetical protein